MQNFLKFDKMGTCFIVLVVLVVAYTVQVDARPRKRSRNVVDKVVKVIKDTVDKNVKDVKNAAQYASEFVKGAGEMGKAFVELGVSNHIGADKYFHAKGNQKAAQHGPGGRRAAQVISDAREMWQDKVSGRGTEDSKQDQEANRHGRNGGDLNKYRPKSLPPWFRK